MDDKRAAIDGVAAEIAVAAWNGLDRKEKAEEAQVVMGCMCCRGSEGLVGLAWIPCGDLL